MNQIKNMNNELATVKKQIENQVTDKKHQLTLEKINVMIFDVDRHDSPDWPADQTPMGIVMKIDLTTKSKHFKITVGDNGNLKTTNGSFENQINTIQQTNDAYSSYFPIHCCRALRIFKTQ